MLRLIFKVVKQKRATATTLEAFQHLGQGVKFQGQEAITHRRLPAHYTLGTATHAWPH